MEPIEGYFKRVKLSYSGIMGSCVAASSELVRYIENDDEADAQ